MMDKQTESKKMMRIFFMVLIIPTVWTALLAAPFAHRGLFGMMEGLAGAIGQPFHIVWCENTPLCLCVFFLAYLMGVGLYYATRRNYRKGEEHGSAKWGDANKLCKKYEAKPFCNNRILTQNFRIGLDGYVHRRNLHTVVLGGSGAGKTRFFCIPNVLQCASVQFTPNMSMVITDPKGEVRREVA